MAEDTRNLISRCLAGDQRSWTAFVDRSVPIISAAVRRMIRTSHNGSEHIIEDCIQNVFIKLLRHDGRLLRSYDPDRAALSTWLTMIARSVTIDQLRRRRPDTVDLADYDSPMDADDPAAATPIEIPLHLLTERQRLVMALLFDDERSVPEAAAILGVNEQTIRSTKHKALERLRRHFDAAGRSDARGDESPAADVSQESRS